MFIYAFSRGIRYGREYTWRLPRLGICFFFYAEHLLPRLNDTHGIGIVLLAGVELLKLQAN